MEEHVALALSRWAKEYNKEWERKRTNDSLMEQRKTMRIFESIWLDNYVKFREKESKKGRKSNAKT